MKLPIVTLCCFAVLNSCLFETPFERQAKFPVDSALTGWWETVPKNSKEDAARMRVLEYSTNEYVVEYPVGEEEMVFRAFEIELGEEKYFQVELIGTAEGSVKAADRKYHLLKTSVDGGRIEIQTVDPEVFGEDRGEPAAMKAAFSKHRDKPGLFNDGTIFQKVR